MDRVIWRQWCHNVAGFGNDILGKQIPNLYDPYIQYYHTVWYNVLSYHVILIIENIMYGSARLSGLLVINLAVYYTLSSYLAIVA